MKTKLAPCSNRLSAIVSAGFAVLFLIALLAFAGDRARAATTTAIRYTGTDFEGRQSLRLDWTAASNATYLVQSATDLAAAGAWQTVDVVTPTNGAGQYEIKGRSIPENSTEFFRLVLPQPQIFSVEPAVVAPGAAVDFYVIGQCFPTNGVLQINGVTQAGTVFGSSSLATIPGFTPGAAGNYQVSLVVGGVVVSSFNVVCADAVANPELVLQGPPDEPPASPSVRTSGHAGEKLEISWETLELKAGKAAPPGGNHPISIPYAGQSSYGVSASAPKSVQVSRSNITNNRMAGGGGGNASGGAMDDKRIGIFKLTPDKGESGSENIRRFSGEVTIQVCDLAIEGRGLDFVWARTYHSRLQHTATLLDSGWTCSYDVHCAQNSSGGMDVYDGTGRKDSFALGTNGLYTCPEFFREGALSNNTFTLTFADTGRWVFNLFDTSAAAGKLHQVITRSGDIMTLGYDTDGRLAQIVDDLGRTNTVAYDTSGRVASVTDFTGRSVTYQYYSGAKSDNGSAGDLKSVTSPPVTGTPNGNDFLSGKTTTYTYSKSFPLDRENHLLLTVTDPKGQTAAVFSYEHSSTSTNYLRCIAAQEGTNTACQFNWTLVTRPAGSYATTKCIVNDPVGNVSESFFDARGRCVIERDYTGRATPGVPVTDTMNRPTGKLRSSDPAYYETQWTWNNDSLRTSEKEPAVIEIPNLRFVYQSDFDPSTRARKRADCRVVRELASSPVDLNGDGVPDVTERAWHFDYDQRFGSDPTPSFGKKLYVGNLPFFSEPDGATAIAIHNKGTGVSGFTDDGNTGGATYMAINEKGLPSGSGKIKHNQHKNLASSRGWDGTIKGMVVPAGNGMAINTKGNGITPTGFTDSAYIGSGREKLKATTKTMGEKWGFCTSATDARGDVTTATYDAKGNRAQWSGQSGTGSTTDQYFAVNSHGQLTAITNAPDANGYRRVDTFSYYTSGPQAGYLQSIAIDESGPRLTSAFEYDARGNPTRYVDPRTNDWLYTYNALNQCVRAQSPPNISARCATDFAYDANDNLVQCATELRDAADNLVGGQTNRFAYDGVDRLTEIAQAVDASHALTNRLIYNGNNQCVQVLGGDAVSGADPYQTVACQYDERGLLFRESSAPGSTSQSTAQLDYDANGNVTRVSEGLEGTPSVTTMEYDGFGGFGDSSPQIQKTAYTMFLPDGTPCRATASLRISKVTGPMGNQTVCFYDANDNLKVVRRFGELNDVAGSAGNVRLAESGYQYNALNRCVSAQDMFFDPATQSPIGIGKATTTFAYAPNSECVSVTDTLGHTTTYGYDTACRLTSVTSPGGTVVYACTRNAAGRPAALLQTFLPNADLTGPPQVFSVTNGYDALNRLVSTTDSAGNTSRCAYDSLGRCVQTTDATGTSTFFSYDLLNRCTLAIGDLNHDGKPDLVNDITTTYTWSSSSGNLLAVTDSHTNTTSYANDSLGRCTSATSPNGTHHTFVWDSHSNLASEQDANGTVIVHTYDLNDRCISNNITPGAGVASTTTFETFTYDGCGRLTGNRDDDCDGVFAYDSLDNCVRETLNGLATASTYDALGNRLSLTYPGGRSLTYAYDTLNRCASIASSGQQLAGYAYAGPNRVSVINYGNGTCAQISYDGFAGTPNATGDHGFSQVRSVRHSVVSGGAVIDDRTLAYDADQNKTIRDMTSPFTLDGVAQAQAFQYDAASRLVASLVTTNGALARLTSYGLDRMGNRTNVTGAASCSGNYTLDATLPSPADFQMNQYTTTPCDSRTYDHNGNLVSRVSSAGPVTYQYDYAGRLVQVQALDSGTGTLAPLARYSYDARGRRAAKSVYSGSATTTTQFLYDGGSVIEERAGGQINHQWCWSSSGRDIGDVNGDGRPDLVVAFTATGAPQYFHGDDQGNTLALTDGSGSVLERYDYDDYGTVTFLASDGTPTTATASAVGNPYCWGGLRLDAETGLQNDDGGDYLETASGRNVDGNLWCWGENRSGMIGNNPWSPSQPPPPVAYKIKAMGANGEGKKEYVGHVSLLK